MSIPLLWMIIGLSYWAINIFARKLHLKNDSGEGWMLVPLWVFGWPLCFVAIIYIAIHNFFINYREEIIEQNKI